MVYSAGGVLHTSMEDILMQWEKYFKGLLNTTDMFSRDD